MCLAFDVSSRTSLELQRRYLKHFLYKQYRQRDGGRKDDR